MSQHFDNYCDSCGICDHVTRDCPFAEEYDGQLQNEHHHKIQPGNENQEEIKPTNAGSFGESIGLAFNRALERRH